MSDITELERRITAALDRIGAGLDGLGSAPAGPDPEMQAALDRAERRMTDMEEIIKDGKQALADERTVTAQLEERLKAVKEKADRHASAMDIQMFEQQQATAKLDSELQRLRRASEDLRASNLSLRASLEQGLSEPHLINKAMLAELETLRATRAVEAAQADAVLAVLDPLVKRAAQQAVATAEAETDVNADAGGEAVAALETDKEQSNA